MNRSIQNKIDAFERAVRAHEFRGAAHPDALVEIDENYVESRDRLMQAVHAMDREIRLTRSAQRAKMAAQTTKEIAT